MADRSALEFDVIVVGAGLAGLTAARELRRRGLEVVVIDKGRSVGGRLATRRIGDARLDHGAQFFTVRSDDFADVVADAIADGVVYEWCRGFGEVEDGHPRYAVTGGMNALAKWLAAGCTTRTACEVDRIEGANGRWTCSDTAGEKVATSTALVMTAPIPQTLNLLERGAVRVPDAVGGALRSVDYFATLALLVTLDGPPAFGAPGGLQFDDSAPFTFIADNHRKGVSEVPAVTFHANHDFSLAQYDADGDETLATLLDMASPWLGSASVVDAQLKKWRYAGPVNPLPEQTLVATSDDAVVAFAGDAFGGPKVEGAFRSGLEAGRAVAGRLLP